MADTNFMKNTPSDTDRKKYIIADLKAAAHAEKLLELIQNDAGIKGGMKINNVKIHEIKTCIRI
jgi:hypothetical protein